MQCVKASGARAFLRASLTGLFRSSASVVPLVKGSRRPRLTPLVAQAYLDDLAASGRADDHSLPLERLSDLARRNGSADVNLTLVELFPQEGTGTLIVLDQRFHPGMNTLAIRVVPPKTSEDASTYDLVPSDAHAPRESGAADAATAEANLGSYWDRPDLTKKEWLGLFKSLEKRKGKLDAPPRENYRDRESYLGLRDLLVADSSARKLFLTVHWKGKPSGLTLLCELLSEGTWVPEVETDGDYLEAEMDHIDKGHADRRPKDDQWKLGHGWTIVREVGEGNARTYRANGKSKD